MRYNFFDRDMVGEEKLGKIKRKLSNKSISRMKVVTRRRKRAGAG